MKSIVLIILTIYLTISQRLYCQSWDLTTFNIDSAIRVNQSLLAGDSMRPAYHLTPLSGCMGDPNGGIYFDGWYHIFFGLQPFAFHPGGWYWAHARSKDLLKWQHMPNNLTPAFDLGLNAIGSGSTIKHQNKVVAFYSQSKGGPMLFWKAEFTDKDLTSWQHLEKQPILSLDHPGLPPFDGFWRDPFVFTVSERTFLIACADLFEEDYVPVPIFEAKNRELTGWDFKGNLFTVPKHRYRNLEVPEFRKIGDRWIFMASTDAPIDRTNYFIGDFDIENLKFKVEQEGSLDYSGHFYAQEAIQNDQGDIILMGWLPGWDRDWLPTYMNEPLKNSNPRWNGCFSLPRELTLVDGMLIQVPVSSVKNLREEKISIEQRLLPVDGSMAAFHVLEKIRGNQLELQVDLDLHNASFVGLNLLSDEDGKGGLFIIWHGDVLNVDGVKVPMKNWEKGKNLQMRIFVDKKFVEVFVDGGKYCISRQVREDLIKGDRVAFTSLGGTGKLVKLEAWKLRSVNNEN